MQYLFVGREELEVDHIAQLLPIKAQQDVVRSDPGDVTRATGINRVDYPASRFPLVTVLPGLSFTKIHTGQEVAGSSNGL
jgi:hypothetical protein